MSRRLKENIEHPGYENGIPIYAFGYYLIGIEMQLLTESAGNDNV